MTRHLTSCDHLSQRIRRVLPMVITLIILGCVCTPTSAQNIQAPKTTIQDYTKQLTPLKGTTPAQWRVTWQEAPATSAIVSWSTAEQGQEHIVYYDTQPRQGRLDAYKHRQVCQRNGQYSGSGKEGTAPAYYHHARLSELKPATTYYLTLVSDGNATKEFHLITAHEDSSDFAILHGGDSRSGHLNRCHMNAMMADMAEADDDLLALAHGGDFINKGIKWSEWRLWLSQHELTTTKAGRLLPIIPARGNHDVGPLLAEIFDFPPKQPIDYVTRLSQDVALITLQGPNRHLENWLKELRPQTRWLLAQYHRPIFPAVKGPGSAKAQYTELFERFNLDLACEADGHCIKRTVPIRDGKPDPTGVTYIGEGGLGVGQRKPDTTRWFLQEPGFATKGSHVFRLDFTKQTLRIQTVLLGGEIFDDHHLKARTQ